VKAREIAANEYPLIADIHRRAANVGVLELLRSLDFDSDRFGSPMLARLFASKSQPFFRKYFLCQSGDAEALVVLSHFPLGVSFNRVPESGWVFILTNDHELTEEAWSNLVQWIQKQSLVWESRCQV